jgi:predicted HTH transcriptional regulator
VEAFLLSVLDDLRSAQQQALTRLTELEPLVAEYEELRREVKRLGLSEATLTNGAAAPPRTTRPSASRAKRSTARRGRRPQPKRSRSNSRGDDIARLVSQQPGVTVAELARSLGVDATSLYRPVRRLMSDGRVRKDGTGLHPVTP